MMCFRSLQDNALLFTEEVTYPALVTFMCVRLALSLKEFCEFFIPLLVPTY